MRSGEGKKDAAGGWLAACSGAGRGEAGAEIRSSEEDVRWSERRFGVVLEELGGSPGKWAKVVGLFRRRCGSQIDVLGRFDGGWAAVGGEMRRLAVVDWSRFGGGGRGSRSGGRSRDSARQKRCGRAEVGRWFGPRKGETRAGSVRLKHDLLPLLLPDVGWFTASSPAVAVRDADADRTVQLCEAEEEAAR